LIFIKKIGKKKGKMGLESAINTGPKSKPVLTGYWVLPWLSTWALIPTYAILLIFQ